MSTSFDVGDVNPKLVTLEEGSSVRTEASLVMEGEERELPEKLVERIIARMPFPSLFKARVLTKRWYSKFSSCIFPNYGLIPCSITATAMSTSFDVGDVNPKWVTLEEGSSVRTEASLVMEGEERELPEELVERIIARMPFPSLFKARVLTKRWYSKFSSASQLGSSEASAFQSQILAKSASWPTYAPVSFHWIEGRSEGRMSLLAFDKSKSQWFELLSETLQNQCPVWHVGTLVLIKEKEGSVLTVRNILTRSYRQLTIPPGFGTRNNEIDLLRFIAGDCHSYKVLAVYSVICPNNNGSRVDALCVHLYDSNSQLWTSTLSKFRDHPALNDLYDFGWRKHCAYMEGKVYFLPRYHNRPPGHELSLKICSYDLEDNAWRIVVEEFDASHHVWETSGIFLCGDKIIVVIISSGATFIKEEKSVEMRTTIKSFSRAYLRKKSIQVFQLDVQSSKLPLISHGPLKHILISGNYKFSGSPVGFWSEGVEFSSDANFVYFNCGNLPDSVVQFDLSTGVWSSVSFVSSRSNFNRETDFFVWIPGTFEPGLNPFVSA